MPVPAGAVPREPEIHIAGVYVQARPGSEPAVSAALAALPNTEVHAVGGTGRLVAVCECASADATLDLIARMRELPGVLNVALVYQHAESAAAMEEEIGHEDDHASSASPVVHDGVSEPKPEPGADRLRSESWRGGTAL